MKRTKSFIKWKGGLLQITMITEFLNKVSGNRERLLPFTEHDIKITLKISFIKSVECSNKFYALIPSYYVM